VTDVFEEIDQIAGIAARKDELLSLHTSFAVGGPCDLMVWVSDIDALKRLLALAKTHSLPVMALGNGSNVLVRDGGVGGVVIRLVDDFATIEAEGEHIHAGAGASLAETVSKATSSGIGGLEFLAGIPGTVGGAVVTNAGSRDVWVSSRLVELGVLTDDLTARRLSPGDLGFGYRHSGIDKTWIVTDVLLAGYRCEVEEARHKVEEYLNMRRTTQPTGENTAGCVFKNPPDDAAGRVIDHAGLKGSRKGGAEISMIHGNWVVNTGGATAGEILDLINETRDKVQDEYGIDLELEINVIGRD
jgi:UDP-N-acetylmuramate dehydrogenase